MKLSEAFTLHGSDKCTEHRYGAVYDQLQQHAGCRSILEIGVHRGCSCKALAEAFPDAVVCGIDIAPLYVSDSERIIILKVDINDADSVWCIAVKYGPFDLIIDDGSHKLADQLAGIANLRPHCRGTYIIEDVQSDEILGEILDKTPGSRSLDLRIAGGLGDDILVLIDCRQQKI